MDGYTLSISRCSGGDGVEESFKAKIKRREAALDAFAVAEAYCKESWMVSRCEREGFDGFIIDLCSDAEDETIRLVRLVPDSEDGIMDDVFRLESGICGLARLCYQVLRPVHGSQDDRLLQCARRA